MKKYWFVILWVLFVIVSCAAFPIYNFNKPYSYSLTGITLYLNIVCFAELGIFEKKILKNWEPHKVVIINLGIILLGMLCRYLLEFGEVSNIYNFTVPNILLHVAATFTISMISYLIKK